MHGVDWNTWGSVVTIIGFLVTVVLPAIRRGFSKTLEKHTKLVRDEVKALSKKLDEHIQQDHGQGVYRGRRTY